MTYLLRLRLQIIRKVETSAMSYQALSPQILAVCVGDITLILPSTSHYQGVTLALSSCLPSGDFLCKARTDTSGGFGNGNISSDSASSILSIISLTNTFVDPFGRQCFVVKFFSPVALFSRLLFSLYDRAGYRQGCCLLFLILSLSLHNVMEVH